MFKVGNADFIADKLASELLPDQEFREAKKNAREAIDRLSGGESAAVGRIEFDVDWMMRRETGNWYICCADDGDGMSRVELERYMTTLAVEGANRNQSITGNQGMGLKISGPTRHKEGLLIRSLKNGDATMVQVGWNKHSKEYGLIPIGQEGELVVSVPEEFFPEFIQERGSGTVVTFLGNSEFDNTFKPANRPNGWLFKYLHRRFFRLSQDGVAVLVRVPSGEVDEWPTSVEESEERMAGRGGKSFNLSRVNGTGEVWDGSADKNGEEKGTSPTRGVVDVAGDPGADQPPARIHWWVLTTSGSDVSTRTSSGGSIAVLYQNELHDWKSSSQANPYFARMGVLFGKTRIGIIIEPLGGNVTSDFARSHVLIGGTPVFEHDALLTWADQFRSQLPEAIKDAIQEEQSRIQSEDPDRAKRIRERLKDVMALLRPRRFRRNPDGSLTATGNPVTGTGGEEGEFRERFAGGPGPRGTSAGTRGIGAVLSQIGDTGESASEVFSILQIEPLWVTEKEAEGMPIVSGDDRGLQDRAAALSGEDGVSAARLLLNKQFRGYQVILDTMNEWANPEGSEDKSQFIEKSVQEWIEQKMVEAVTGLRQLENGSTWTAMSFDEAFSPVALTVAF
ncbi:MAG: ATP-binding protein, partial [Methylocella sp.]